MLPTTINLNDAQEIIKNITEREGISCDHLICGSIVYITVFSPSEVNRDIIDI